MLGLDMTSWLIGSGLSDCSSDQVRVKVVYCKSLTSLSLNQWLFNHQGSVLAPYKSPPTANRWPHWGVLPLCRGAVSIFYSPSWQGNTMRGDSAERYTSFNSGDKGHSRGERQIPPKIQFKPNLIVYNHSRHDSSNSWRFGETLHVQTGEHLVSSKKFKYCSKSKFCLINITRQKFLFLFH